MRRMLTLPSISRFSLAPLALALVLAPAACSSSDDTPSPTNDAAADVAADTSDAAAEAASDAPAETAAEASTDAGDASETAAATCATYCSTLQGACSGARAQFSTLSSCIGTCAGFPAGTTGDTSGNSLACRAYHAAAAVADPATHCKHAGPGGGDGNPTDATAGACGEACDSFCGVAMAICTGANAQWASKADCLTTCKAFHADAADYSTADTSKNDYNCRFYHLSVAATDATSAAMHCPHVAAASPVCTN